MANPQTDYLKKAHKLNEAGFYMFGMGNFDISDKELALILELVEKNDFDAIDRLYKELEYKVFGGSGL